MTTDRTAARTSAFYEAIDAFQRTHRLPGLQHAQIRGLLAKHLARVLPAAPAPPPPADRADLRDRIAEVLWPLTDWDGDQLNAEAAADAVLAVLPEPTDRAAEERDRDFWKSECRKAERIRENADFHLGQEMARRQLAEKEADRLRAELRRMAAEEQPATEARQDGAQDRG